jgi:hypothetical protein
MNSSFYNGQNNQNTHQILANNGVPVLDFRKSRQVDNSSSLSARNLSPHALSSTSTRTKSPYRLANTINMNSSIVSSHNKYNLNPPSTFNNNINLHTATSSSSSYRPIIIQSNYTKSPLNNRG